MALPASPAVRALLALVAAAALGVAGLAGWRALATPLPVGEPERTVAAFGFVEEVRTSRAPFAGETRCTVKVAIYEWLSLSAGFPLVEIPRRNDRYLLRGAGDDCTALTVAMATTSGHIAFEAGAFGSGARRQWHFVTPPGPAVGCGALAIDWKPDPE